MRKNIIGKLLPAALALLIVIPASAQSQAEIRAAKSMAKSYGYSETEIDQIMKNRNGSNGTTGNLQGVTTSTNAAPVTPQQNFPPDGRADVMSFPPEDDEFELLNPEDSLTPKPIEIFGHKYFKSKGLALIPSYNAPAPASYVLSPGDEVVIDIWGASNTHVNTTIDNNGSIPVFDIGPVYVGGMTIAAAEQSLRAQLSSIYSGLDAGDSGDTHLRLTVGRIKGVTVSVAGEVVVPGAYTIPSLVTIPSAIFLAGGITETGSVRNISLYRGGQKVGRFDLYELICKGRFDQNLRLQENDIISVEPIGPVVTVTGEAVRPVRYEMREGETVSDLLLYSGGFTSDARRDQVNVARDNGTSSESFDVDESKFKTFKIQDRDFLNVRGKPVVLRNKVNISGPVLYPGDYAITSSLNDVAALIEAAGGLRDGAYTGRGQISRLDENRMPAFVSFDLDKVMSRKEKVALFREDSVKVFGYEDFIEDFSIAVDGGVIAPGKFEFKDGMTVADALILAGGVKDEAYMIRGQVHRYDKDGVPTLVPFNINNVLAGQANVSLMRGDSIVVYSVRELREEARVRVVGEVQRKDTTFTFLEGMTLEDAIIIAGGFTNGADLTNIEISGRGGRTRGSVSVYDLESRPEALQAALKPYDLVSVRRLTYYKPQTAVTMSGEVVSPGTYSIDKSQVRLSDVLQRAGGVTEEAYIRGAKLTRVLTEEEKQRQELAVAIANQNLTGKDTIDVTTLQDRYFIGIELDKAVAYPGSQYDIVLRAGDIIEVPAYNATVKISGGVFYPNTVAYVEDMNWKDYVDQAGGFTKLARRSKAYAIYMNGKVMTAKKGMKVEPGCEIIVPEKKESEERKTSPAEIAAMASSATSIASLVISLIKLL